MKRKLFVILALIVALSLVLVACGPTEEPTEAPAPTEAPEATKAPEAPPESLSGTGQAHLDAALAGEYAGTTVSMFGPFVDADEVLFNNSIKDFEETTGIDIQYVGTKEFETTISVRVDAGDPPDIVDFPQPGLLANFVRGGHVIDVRDFMNDEWLEQNYLQSWLDMAMMDGVMAGVWARFNAKSQVFYPKEPFEAAGYEIPTTWDELIALSDQIVADGDTPWCIGMESGTATGWPATDWMEDFMLRTTSLDNYDKWTRGELAFSSPEVTNAAEMMSSIWLNPDYVYGGTEYIISTRFSDAVAPMWEDPPQCWLHRQGNFITSFFPEGSVFDFFYFPPIDPQYGKPYLVAGDIYAMFNDRPEVRAVMEFFTTGESLKGWIASGGALSPHNDTQLDWYGNETERGIAALVQGATAVRFDGSDLMPGEVGAGSFWKGMTDYIAGSVDLDTALEEIDAAWPR
jgi:alpha-glucoside transport system substrate-binding protein